MVWTAVWDREYTDDHDVRGVHLSCGPSSVVDWRDSIASSSDSWNLGDIVGFYDWAAGHGVPVAGGRRLTYSSVNRRRMRCRLLLGWCRRLGRW